MYVFVYGLLCFIMFSLFFFFNDTATTEIYTLSLHDALPISRSRAGPARRRAPRSAVRTARGRSRCRSIPCRSRPRPGADRKSTRLNSSHANISYAVFCLKKKKKTDKKNNSKLGSLMCKHTQL